jgi:hypothetical protein
VVAKLIDGGTNICVTGDLSTLVNVEEIPPMPISVAIAGNDISSDALQEKMLQEENVNPTAAISLITVKKA